MGLLGSMAAMEVAWAADLASSGMALASTRSPVPRTGDEQQQGSRIQRRTVPFTAPGRGVGSPADPRVGEGRGLQAGWPHLPSHVNPVAEAGNHHPLLGRRRRHGNLAALCTVVIPARVSRLGFLLEESDFVVSLGGMDRGLRGGSGEMIGGPSSGRNSPGSGQRRRWRKEEEEAL
jgi:hypothetical protein